MADVKVSSLTEITTRPKLSDRLYILENSAGTFTSKQIELEKVMELVPAELIIACSDESTALTTGTAKVTFRMPYTMKLTEVRASLTGAGSTSGTTTVDINESGTTILSTKLTIDYSEKTSTTAATAAVISDSVLVDDAEITIDIDAVTGGADEKGLKVYLIGYRVLPEVS